MREKTIWFGDYRGVRFEINKFEAFKHNDAKFSWTFYLHLLAEQFPENDRPKLQTKTYYTAFGTKIEIYDGPLEDLPWHGGMTWSSEETKINSDFKSFKFGCDYQHLWDDGHYYELSDVKKEVEECIDALHKMFPEIKDVSSVYDDERKKFPGAHAGDDRYFDKNGKVIPCPYEWNEKTGD